jgi:hypothetical protein
MSQEFLPFLSENRITELKIELDNGHCLKVSRKQRIHG